MRLIESVASRMGIMGDLILFFLQNKWWWLTPMIVLLLLFAVLMVFAQSSAIGPFIYTLF